MLNRRKDIEKKDFQRITYNILTSGGTGMEKENCLKVQMLGDFIITYKGKIVQLGKNQTTKALQLLQLLLYAGSQGITRLQLMERLYGSDMEGDRANNLRVTVFHLRRLLKNSELPKEQYIRTEDGRYRFESSFPIEIDIVQFEHLLEQADKAGACEQRLELLKKACYYYKGYFLPALSAEEWVIVAGIHFQNLYFAALEEVCGQMKRRREFTELLELCSRAASLYPFDEWQVYQIECLLGLERPKEAMALYEKTTEMYFDELDMPPSERMVECFRQMSSQIQLNTGDFNEIHKMLREEPRLGGAYYCTYPSFMDIYRIIVRIMERSGQSVYLLLCTVLDERQRQMEDSEGLKRISECLAEAIQETLRRGDTFTRYNISQYLVLLTGVCREDCHIATSRIDACFRKKVSSRRVHVNYRVASIADIPGIRSESFVDSGQAVNWEEKNGFKELDSASDSPLSDGGL